MTINMCSPTPPPTDMPTLEPTIEPTYNPTPPSSSPTPKPILIMRGITPSPVQISTTTRIPTSTYRNTHIQNNISEHKNTQNVSILSIVIIGIAIMCVGLILVPYIYKKRKSNYANVRDNSLKQILLPLYREQNNIETGHGIIFTDISKSAKGNNDMDIVELVNTELGENITKGNDIDDEIVNEINKTADIELIE
eukprot:368059_1